MRHVAVVLMFVASSLWAQKVDVGYDKRVDFSQFKTYAWAENLPKTNRPLMALVITGAVDEELGKRGLTKVASNPDLVVTFHGGVDVQGSFAADDPTYSSTGGLPAPDVSVWSGSSSAASPAVHKGTLIVDLINQEHLVWRGTAEANLDNEKKSKTVDQVNKAVEDMFKKYPPPSH
jgi:Domain of unknown function (DUF4136)